MRPYLLLLAALATGACDCSAHVSRGDAGGGGGNADCSGRTPGVIECGGGQCRKDRCFICYDADAGFPFSGAWATAFCVPDGGTPPDGGSEGCAVDQRDCDGPEDCPPGLLCASFEYGAGCTDKVFPEDLILCHCNADCPEAAPLCVGGYCQP